MKVVVDTDVDFDDVVALLFLMRRKDVDVQAITITGAGMTYLDGALTIIRKLATLTGRTIPIGIGTTSPLVGDRQFPSEWRKRTTDILLDLLSSVPEERSREEGTATDILKRYLSSDTTLIVLGPATNIARLLLSNYKIDSKIVVMGGAIGNHQGNVLEMKGVEYNVWIDPISFGIMASIPISLIPLNVTDKVPVTGEVLQMMSRTPIGKIAAEASAQLVVVNHPEVVFFWDPLAILIAISDESEIASNTKYVEATIGVDSFSGSLKLFSPGTSKIYLDVSPSWFYANLLSILSV